MQYIQEQTIQLPPFLIASDFTQSIGRSEPVLQRLQSAYKQVINSLIYKSVIPYYPNLYPIPFMIIKRYRVRFYITHILFYALTYPDVKDFNKFAVYIYQGSIKNFPEFYLD
jgi:hypothetical protein